MKHRTTRRLLLGAISFILPLALFLAIREKASWRPRVLGQHKGRITEIVWSPDGKWLASCTSVVHHMTGGGKGVMTGGNIYLWSVANGKHQIMPGKWKWRMQFLKGNKLAWQTQGDNWGIYDTKKPQQPPRIINMPGYWVFSPDGQMLGGEKAQPDDLAQWKPDTLVLHHLADGKETKLRISDTRSTAMNERIFSTDSQRFALSVTSGPEQKEPSYWVWNIKTPGKPRIFKGHEQMEENLTFWPGNSTIASVSGDGVRLYDTNTGRLKQPRIETSGTTVLSPTGDMIAYGSGGDIDIISYPALRPLRKLGNSFIGTDIRPMAFSPDGTTLAVSDDQGIITLWRVK
ncbi:MAG TPA: WD40 repeat domain-containing protein [Abditibacteriaceae bacterium]|jgi:WD40 repeat protein